MKRAPSATALGRLLLRWFAETAEDLPWRRTTDPYAVWVSEIMLQQTQVATVAPYFERWMKALPDVRALAAAPLDRVLKLWEGLGYYTRARNLHRAAAGIVVHHGGRFPSDFDAVLALPGVGRYTAGAICSIAFNQPRPILDGNVVRVLARVFAIEAPVSQATTQRLLWERAGELVKAALRAASPLSRDPMERPFPPLRDPAEVRRRASGSILRPPPSILAPARSSRISPRLVRRCPCGALNQSLMELGRRVCTPRQPACGDCPLKRLCLGRKQERLARLPNLAKRVATVPHRRMAVVIERNGRFLVRQRPAGTINGGLWEFLNEPIIPDEDSRQALLARWPQLDCDSLRPLAIVRHSITHRRITLEAWRARPRKGARFGRDTGVWLDVGALRELAFPSAHRRLVRELERAP